jgi:diadenosine tetraphosphate (Ap4A) HIT family hydrolase
LLRPDKLNIAALGNIVSQLHVHLIVRYTQDVAWPQPVWGYAQPVAYADDAREDMLGRLREALKPLFV